MFANKISEVILSLSKMWFPEIGAASTSFRSCEVGDQSGKRPRPNGPYVSSW